MKSALTHLACSECGRAIEAVRPVHLCMCGRSLLARYDLEQVRRGVDREALAARPPGLWRFFELLPVRDPEHVVSLGEGDTPLLDAGGRLKKLVGIKRLWVKEEGLNPTGSFKARGMAVAVSKAVEFGVQRVGLPTAGNAGAAAAWYGARAGIEVHVFMPKRVLAANVREVSMAGARAYFVGRTIEDSARGMARWKEELDLYDLSTLKEPYRVEGKKIMAYEIAEALGWRLPDVMVVPTGGGTGVIGLWKALQEMKVLGWVEGRLPRIVAVQSAACAPVVKAVHDSADECETWEASRSVAPGLAVARPFADRLLLRSIRESGGTAVAVSEDSIRDAVNMLGTRAGISASPEGAACIPAIRALRERGALDAEEEVVFLNTASGFKYADALR